MVRLLFVVKLLRLDVTGFSASPDDQPALVHANGQRQMLPPSPHTYYPRFQQRSSSISNGNHAQNVIRDLPPPPQHRPSSSMSISSMLGSDSDRPARDQNPAATSTTSSSHQSRPRNPSNPFSEMSPPQHTVKPGLGDYSYKPRSQTPGRMGISNLIGARPHRSGSGSIMQGSTYFEDPAKATSRTAFSRFGESVPQAPNQQPIGRTEDSARRTSISGILQRPSSQPQPQVHSTFPGPRLQPVNHPHLDRPAWPEHSNPQSSLAFNNSSPPSLGVNRASEYVKDSQNGQQGPSTMGPTQYDIRPPLIGPPVQQQPLTLQDRDVQPGASAWERRSSNSISPDIRRQMASQSQYRPFGGLLIGQPPVTNSQPQDSQQPTSVPMSQQDSSQSHGERSIFGERLDKSRSRLFSPFAGSYNSQNGPSASAPPGGQSRKGSDELSQHRALLGLAAEGKRGGRYSPLPQAVQGAQAQSTGPEVGIKSEHGRIFSGIGSGVGTASASPAHGPVGLVASPFKRDDNGPRLLNEDNLMKISRSTSGFGKRARKVKDEDGKAASENDGNGRVGKKARNHQ